MTNTTDDVGNAEQATSDTSAQSACNGLLCCPSCFLDEVKWAKLEKILGQQDWGNYKPISYKDHLTERWVIECNNCGLIVLFNVNTEDESIQCWNELPRKK